MRGCRSLARSRYVLIAMSKLSVPPLVMLPTAPAPPPSMFATMATTWNCTEHAEVSQTNPTPECEVNGTECYGSWVCQEHHDLLTSVSKVLRLGKTMGFRAFSCMKAWKNISTTAFLPAMTSVSSGCTCSTFSNLSMHVALKTSSNKCIIVRFIYKCNFTSRTVLQ